MQSFEEIFPANTLWCILFLANLPSLLTIGCRLIQIQFQNTIVNFAICWSQYSHCSSSPQSFKFITFTWNIFKRDKPSQFFKCKLTKKTFNTKLFFQKNALDYQTYFNSVRICEMFLSALMDRFNGSSTLKIWQPLTWNIRCVSTRNISMDQENSVSQQFAKLHTSIPKCKSLIYWIVWKLKHLISWKKKNAIKIYFVECWKLSSSSANS